MGRMSARGQRLPEGLGAGLPSVTRDALQHPFRRQILRALHQDAQKLSASELAKSGLVPCSVPCASYHMNSLHDAELVKREASETVGNCTKHYFSSVAGDKSPVLRVLRDTEQSDSEFFAHGATG